LWWRPRRARCPFACRACLRYQLRFVPRLSDSFRFCRVVRTRELKEKNRSDKTHCRRRDVSAHCAVATRIWKRKAAESLKSETLRYLAVETSAAPKPASLSPPQRHDGLRSDEATGIDRLVTSRAQPAHACGESLGESRLREIRTSGSTRGEVRGVESLPLLLYRHPRPRSPTVPLLTNNPGRRHARIDGREW